MQILFHAKEFVQTDALSYSDWLQYRRNGIGGSDLAAICGISKYKTLLHVYLEKLGEAPEDTMSETAEWGTRLEPLIADKFAYEHPEWAITEKKVIYCHPDHYQSYYKNNGLNITSATPTINNKQPTTSNNTRKSVLTAKLKNRPSATNKQMQEAWQQLAGSLDGFDEWVKKKDSEQITEEQMLQMLQKKMSEKQNAKSA